MKFQVGIFAVPELAISTLAQFDILPTEFSSVLIQLPIEKIFDRIELLTQQLAVNSSAINEAMRLAELAEELKKLVDK